MRPKSLILLLLALGCGLVAAIGINKVLASRPTEQAAETGEMMPIFVALTDIGMGDPLTPEVLKLEEWPKTKVPAGALTIVRGRGGPPRGPSFTAESRLSKPNCSPRVIRDRGRRT